MCIHVHDPGLSEAFSRTRRGKRHSFFFNRIVSIWFCPLLRIVRLHWPIWACGCVERKEVGAGIGAGARAPPSLSTRRQITVSFTSDLVDCYDSSSRCARRRVASRVEKLPPLSSSSPSPARSDDSETGALWGHFSVGRQLLLDAFGVLIETFTEHAHYILY